MQEKIDAVLNASANVRYVAVYRNGTLTMGQRSSLPDATSSESDRYEELLVNPTVLKILEQRGNIDCGGFQFVLIRYGRFFQFVFPIQEGHVSAAIEPGPDPLATAELIRKAFVPESN